MVAVVAERSFAAKGSDQSIRGAPTMMPTWEKLISGAVEKEGKTAETWSSDACGRGLDASRERGHGIYLTDLAKFSIVPSPCILATNTHTK